MSEFSDWDEDVYGPDKPDYMRAHKHSSAHEYELWQSGWCGCFYCLEIFDREEITEWVNDEGGRTALCPYCGIDSVIGDKSGYPIDKEFLGLMKNYWF
jgi:hypothetical protein